MNLGNIIDKIVTAGLIVAGLLLVYVMVVLAIKTGF